MHRFALTATTLVAAISFGVLPSGATSAYAIGPQSAQQQIDAALAAVPGGTQTGPNSVSWFDGEMTMIVPSGSATTLSVGSCATGSYCAYSSTNLTGTKLVWTSCGTYSTAAITVRSMANATSSDTVRGKNASGTTLVTLDPSERANTIPVGITQVVCS